VTDLYANWASIYDFYYPDRSEEVAFWGRLAAPFGLRMLDLMCGTAEVSLGLARRGFGVLGLDLSAAMLAVAAERLATAADYPASNLTLAQSDACAIAAPDSAFDFALVGGNGSFNHLNEQQAPPALRELGRTIRKGGGLWLELVNPHLLKEIYPERTFGPFRPTPPGMTVEKTTWNRYDRSSALFHIRQVTRTRIDGQEGEFEESFSLRVWERDEVGALLTAAGFTSVRFYGGHDLKPFGQWSSDLLAVATNESQRRATL
jgi:ubiquinone/menaquinone biosynthesis C-methylase UbiE